MHSETEIHFNFILFVFSSSHYCFGFAVVAVRFHPTVVPINLVFVCTVITFLYWFAVFTHDPHTDGFTSKHHQQTQSASQKKVNKTAYKNKISNEIYVTKSKCRKHWLIEESTDSADCVLCVHSCATQLLSFVFECRIRFAAVYLFELTAKSIFQIEIKWTFFLFSLSIFGVSRLL